MEHRLKFQEIPNKIVFDLDKNDKVLKLISIIKDINNPENISNKFKLGIITLTIKTFKYNHYMVNCGHKKTGKIPVKVIIKY